MRDVGPTVVSEGPSLRMRRRRAWLIVGGIAALAALVPGAGISQGASGSKYYDVDASSWTCKKAYGSEGHPYRVRAVNVTQTTGQVVDLKSGCSGYVDLTVATKSEDMVKMRDGVHNLTLTGSIACAGRSQGANQTGLRASGGQNVTISMLISCHTSNDGGIRVASGQGTKAVPENVVCDRCVVLPAASPAITLGNSTSSGARGSKLFLQDNTTATKTSGCIVTDDGGGGPPTGVVNDSNNCEDLPTVGAANVQVASGLGRLVR
jgi:hypothetical protein